MKLIIYPDDVLRKPTNRVPIFDDGLRRVVQEMGRIMLKHRGIGLAAPQVGLSRKLILCWDGDKAKKVLIMCNPEILSLEGEQTGPEGCLSFPDQWFEVTRAETVTCRYQDLRGKFQTITTNGLLARCIQHEFDHINGKLFIDYGGKVIETFQVATEKAAEQ